MSNNYQQNSANSSTPSCPACGSDDVKEGAAAHPADTADRGEGIMTDGGNDEAEQRHQQNMPVIDELNDEIAGTVEYETINAGRGKIQVHAEQSTHMGYAVERIAESFIIISMEPAENNITITVSHT